MKFISHRGNISGRIPENENHPDYIDVALKKRFDVEVDVWNVDGKLYLGHDLPQYEVGIEYFTSRFNSLWCHAKNIEALNALITKGNINCFWHQNDDYTLTSNGYIWTYPQKKVINTKREIVLLFDIVDLTKIELSGGICSDHIEYYYNLLKQ